MTRHRYYRVGRIVYALGNRTVLRCATAVEAALMVHRLNA